MRSANTDLLLRALRVAAGEREYAAIPAGSDRYIEELSRLLDTLAALKLSIAVVRIGKE